MKRRLKDCVEAWPDCREGAYDPRCCRFPKSCSCTVYDEQRVSEDELEPTAPDRATVKRIVEAFFACGVDTDQIEAIEDRHIDDVMRFLSTGLKPWEVEAAVHQGSTE